MEQPQVDLSQIRGDWHFHMNYVSHAIDVTLARGLKEWTAVSSGAPATVGALVTQLSSLWTQVSSNRDARGSVRIEATAVAEFEAACRATKEPCDAWVKQQAGSPPAKVADVKAFAESCRQLRAMCDDLDLMREQQPG